MKQAMCGKVTPVAYQNVDIGKGPGNVICKVGPKAGLQQCGAGGVGGADSAAAAYKVPNHLEADSAAAWNIIALSMYIRSQSPDSTGCVLAPLASTHLNSASFRASEGEKLSTSDLYSGTTFGTRLDKSNFVSKEKNVEGGHLERISSGSKESGSGSWSCDSGDVEKSCLSHSWGEQGTSLRLPYASRWGTSDRPSQQQQVSAGLELSSSSSIGECEDSSCSSAARSHEESFGGEMEVESVPRGGPLNHMSALESSLPIKRGLSKFWSGKAKSFTSLTAVSSIEDLAKAEDPYARRRRITSTFGERHKSFPPLSRSSTSGISKRSTSSSGSRSGLAVAFAMGSTLEEVPKMSPPSGAPLARHSNRSMSLTDLDGRRSYHFSPPGAV